MVKLAGGTPDDPPDDLVMASLLGHHAHLAQRRGRAARYRPDVSPFTALPPDADEDDWRDLALLAATPPRGSRAQGGQEEESRVEMLLAELPRWVPDGWSAVGDPLPGVQMVDARVGARASDRAVVLGVADVGDMLALTRATRPGPFEPGTYLMGRYLGVRRGGALVAMAGERMHPAGWVEVSAVCTDPSVRGQGLAGELVRAVVAGVRARGERALLHVEDGSPARALYERLGFEVRRPVTLHRLRAPRADDLAAGETRAGAGPAGG